MPRKLSSEKQATERVRSTIVYDKDPSLDYTRILASCSSGAYKRSTIKTSETVNELRFDISAADVVALMASTNSILRRLQVIEATSMR
jgi:tRNA threonylcarbamoyladenosine modification (KEOPS) complex  Pcc1 subunit